MGAFLGKNGGDSTQLAVMISRQETGKDKVLKIDGGYHGANGWMQEKVAWEQLIQIALKSFRSHGTILKNLMLSFQNLKVKSLVLFQAHFIIQPLRIMSCQKKVIGNIFRKFVMKKYNNDC